MNAVEREGDTVLRNAGPWTTTVHALLTHLRAAGIDGVPQPLGIDTSANPPREQLTYIDGHVPLHPLPEWVWHDNVLSDGASWLRRSTMPVPRSLVTDRRGSSRSANPSR